MTLREGSGIGIADEFELEQRVDRTRWPRVVAGKRVDESSPRSDSRGGYPNQRCRQQFQPHPAGQRIMRVTDDRIAERMDG